MTKEQRRAQRVRTRLTTRVTAMMSEKPYRALTKDVSAGGLRVVIEDVLDRGTVVEVDIQLPDRSEPIVCQAVVAWSRPVPAGEGPSGAETGIQFVSIDPKDRNALLHYARVAPTDPPPPA